MTKFTRRQSEIIDAAIVLLARGGVQELTTRKISLELGTAEAATYRHFKSKQDILLGVLERFKEMAMQAGQKVEESLQRGIPGYEMAEWLFKSRARTLSGNKALAAVIFSEELFRDDPRLSEKVFEIMKISFDSLNMAIERGREERRIRKDLPAGHLTSIILASLRLTVTRWRMSGYQFDLIRESEEMWTTLNRLITAGN